MPSKSVGTENVVEAVSVTLKITATFFEATTSSSLSSTNLKLIRNVEFGLDCMLASQEILTLTVIMVRVRHLGGFAGVAIEITCGTENNPISMS